MITVPNFLTVFRIMVTPIIVYFLLQDQYAVAILLFFFAAISDFFDGFFARSLKQETVLGSYLDPLADKIFLVSLVFYVTNYLKLLPFWFFYLLFLRELIQIMGVLFYYYDSKTMLIPPSIMSKTNTFLLMILLFCALLSIFYPFLSSLFSFLIFWLGVICTVLTICSFFEYAAIFLINKFYLK